MSRPQLLAVRALGSLVSVAGLVAALGAPRARVPTIDDLPVPESARTAPHDREPGLTAVTSANPFRRGRRAPPERYSVELALAPPPPEPEPPPPPPARPDWRVTGILWGPNPVAVIEALAGDEPAHLLSQGDSVGPVKIESIGPDSVAIVHGDSTWTFRLAAPWRSGSR